MNTYLFAAYVVIWTILFFYLVYLTRKQKRINEELKAMSQTIREHEE